MTISFAFSLVHREPLTHSLTHLVSLSVSQSMWKYGNEWKKKQKVKRAYIEMREK